MGRTLGEPVTHVEAASQVLARQFTTAVAINFSGKFRDIALERDP